MTKVKLTLPLRNTAHAKRVMAEHYPFKCCVICGIDLNYGIDIAHLDQNSANNDPDNLAWLCRTHHAMYDSDLYPEEAVKMLRDRWQITKGTPDHRARMKDAGQKAARLRQARDAKRMPVYHSTPCAWLQAACGNA